MKRELLQAVVHLILWVAGFYLAYFIVSHSEAKIVYGVICGWWFACYFGFVFDIKIRVIVPAYILYVSLCIMSIGLEMQWFYKGGNALLDFNLGLIILFQGLLFVSPICINTIVLSLRKKFRYKFK